MIGRSNGSQRGRETNLTTANKAVKLDFPQADELTARSFASSA
jgi:hypothetical protein